MYSFMQHAHVWWHNKIKETGDFKIQTQSLYHQN